MGGGGEVKGGGFASCRASAPLEKTVEVYAALAMPFCLTKSSSCAPSRLQRKLSREAKRARGVVFGDADSTGVDTCQGESFLAKPFWTLQKTLDKTTVLKADHFVGQPAPKAQPVCSWRGV